MIRAQKEREIEVLQLQQDIGRAILAGALFSALFMGGCSEDSSSSAAVEPAATPALQGDASTQTQTPAEPVVDNRTPEQLVAAGRSVYMANCIACHSMTPTQDGALGPAVGGASLELLEARVLRGEYPEGYTPKRPSRVMIPLPHLEPKLPELAAYLGSFD